MKRSINFSTRSFAGWAFGMAFAAVTGAASADVLYEQPPIDGGEAAFSTTTQGVQLADDFSLGGAASLNRISWWGSYFDDDDQGDAFYVRLYSNTPGGSPEIDFGLVTVAKNEVSGMTDFLAQAVYRYDFTPSPAVTLSAGTYYLSVLNEGSSDWLWLTGDQTGASGAAGSASLLDQTAPVWSDEAFDLAFRLTGTPAQIPEPGSLALLLLAGAALGFSRRRPLAG